MSSNGSLENNSEDSEQESSHTNLTANLFLNKRQEMKVRLLEAANELEPELQPDRLVCLIGEPDLTEHEEPSQPLLSVRSSWLRVHNKKWILGTTLLNTSQSQTVSLSTPALLTVPWLPVVATPHCFSWVEGGDSPSAGLSRAKRARKDGAWKATLQLPPGTLAHSLTVIDVDLTWPDTVLVKQGFQFTANGVEDGVTSAHELTAQGSKDPARRVFPRGAASSQNSSVAESETSSTPSAPEQFDLAPELLSVQVTSELLELVVSAPESANLRRQLTSTVGFESASPVASRSYMLHRGARSPLLKGVLLIANREALDRAVYQISVYTRDASQFERFLRAIMALPEVKVSAPQPPPDAQRRLKQALHLEQRFVQTQLSRMLRKPEISEEQFRKFRLRLSDIELTTDETALAQRGN